MRPTNEGYVRRSDLALRTTYPFLKTRLFEISPHRYRIVFDRQVLEAATIAKEFADSIRFVTANVDLANELPETYLRELPPIADAELAKDFQGLPLRQADVVNLLASQFPDLELARLDETHLPTVRFIARGKPEPDLKEKVETFWRRLANGSEAEVVFDEAAPSRPTIPSNVAEDPLHILAARLRPKAPRFVRDDEAFWFENLNRLYEGEIRNDQIPGAQIDGLACFLDFSRGIDQMNLRQAITLYDTVLITPPILTTVDVWKAQGVDHDDLLKLVETGRVRFILVQPEERCETTFLEAAHERNPDAIVGRRATAAVLLADLVATNRKYRLNDPELASLVPIVAKTLSDAIGAPADELIRFFMWPTAAVRQSVMPILDRGAMGAPLLGLGSLLANQIKRITGRDFSLECLIYSIQLHLAHAFNATSILPRGDPNGAYLLTKMMGDRLNFYRSFDKTVAAAWVGNEKRKEDRKEILPALPLFEFDRHVPLIEIAEFTSHPSMKLKGRALVRRLSGLSSDEQKQEVARLIDGLRRLKGREESWFSLDSFDDISSVADAAVGISAPPALAAWRLLKRVLESARQYPAVDKFVDAIASDIAPSQERRDVDFLSKVSRVGVVLRRNRIS